MCILTNADDITAELGGYLIEVLIAAGKHDLSYQDYLIVLFII